MSETRCNLKRDRGEANCSIAEFIATRAEKTPPLLIWAEPNPSAVDLAGNTGRRIHSLPLVRGIPEWLDKVPLTEARLFWQNLALHVVARDEGGCLWATIEEGADGGEEVIRSERRVVTLADHQRFGLMEQPAFSDLRAIEYRQQGRLVAWCLTLGEK